ncbi:5'-nucleotidase C-terminal domain-containing protein [Alkalicoccus chagannorensis]|uniref:5'-nucleotidase C-terminal domain-containing protein n=1 Tax=Alkalicoccus chagannorensis TaxID=427072 RepID=UPI00040E3D6C|nr:5'-nucleotidase C-terminal domain-containing protein [Alkalicoccus chagannorensis]
MKKHKGSLSLFAKGSLAAAAAMMIAAPAASADDRYDDVDSGLWYSEAISDLTDQGVFSGYGDSTFGVRDNITRGQVAATLYRAIQPDSADLDVLSQYDDVDEDTYFAYEIAALSEAGIFSGYAGSFSPEDQITREQLASVLVRSFNLQGDGSAQVDVDDVHSSHQADVQTIADLGLTTELDNFRGGDALTRAEYATFLHRTWNLEQDDSDAAFDLNIFHTNDLHGRTAAYPQMVTAYEQAQEDYGDGLLLEAGDIFSGTLYFNEFLGQDSLEFMNYMGYDAWVLGNHEFDLGDAEVENAHPDLIDFIDGADFPTLGANMDFSAYPGFPDDNKDGITRDAGSGIYDGIVKEVDGEEIGIFGLNTEDTIDISSPLDVEFQNYLETAENMVAQFEEEGIDKVIALTHLGYETDPSVGNDVLLAENVEGIDVIIGGHSHDEIDPPRVITEDADGNEIEPTIIGQAGEYGEHVGAMNVSFDENGVVTAVDGELYATDDFDADPTAAEMLEPYTEQVEEVQNESAGSTVVNELPNPRGDYPDNVRAAETALGNLITDGQMRSALTANEDVIFAVQNGGGIRTDIAEGDVTVGELIEVQPFGNRLATLDLTGEEIYEAFETSVKDVPEENGGFLHVSREGRITFDSDNEEGDRVESIEVNRDGEWELLEEDEEMHTVAMNNFTAGGGDGFEVFANATDEDRGTIIGFTDWEMLRDYMQELGEVDYSIEGRIINRAYDDNNDN